MRATLKWSLIAAMFLLGASYPALAVAAVATWAFCRELGR